MKCLRICSAGILALLMILSGCSTPDLEVEGTSQDHPSIAEDELIVLDPPENYLKHLPDLGLEVLEVHKLKSLGENLYHLRITDGSHPLKGLDKHKERFPDVLVDVHHHYEHHAKKPNKSYTARKAAGWLKERRHCSEGIRIGVVDGDVDLTHPAFKGTKMTYRQFFPSFKKPARTGHGTAVVSTITGHAPWTGVLPGAEIFAANIFQEGRKGKPLASAINIARAIDWLISERVPIINMSIGGPKNAFTEHAVKRAAEKGVVVIASAGNSGPFTKKKSYPAAFPSVIAITAVDEDSRNARFASAGKYIDFAAPGVRVWTAANGGGGKAMSGTSFAAPIFTSMAAAAMQHRDVKTTEDVKAFFRKYAIDTANEGRDKYTGWGVIKVSPICAK